MLFRKRRIHNKEPDIRTVAGFTTFYGTYVEFVFDTCYRYLGEVATSQNITSEIFTSIWERRKVLYEDNWESDLWKRYLSKAVKHKIYDYLRKKEQLKRYISLAVHETTSFENTTEVNLYYGELSDKIDMLVSQLPPKCKEVFQLSREEGLSYKEISEHLAISVNAVNKHITKALRILRENLTDDPIPSQSAGT